MQLTLTRRGGFAGIRPPATVVETDDLAPAVAKEIERLLSDADLPSIRPVATDTPQPDRFSYTLSIARHAAKADVYSIEEAAATPQVHALIRAIHAAAKKC